MDGAPSCQNSRGFSTGGPNPTKKKPEVHNPPICRGNTYSKGKQLHFNGCFSGVYIPCIPLDNKDLGDQRAATIVGWRPSLLGWTPSLVGWRLSLLGWRPSLVGWWPSLVGWRPSLVGWRPSPVGWRPSLVGWWPSLLGRRQLLLGWRPSLLSWRPNGRSMPTKSPGLCHFTSSAQLLLLQIAPAASPEISGCMATQAGWGMALSFTTPTCQMELSVI